MSKRILLVEYIGAIHVTPTQIRESVIKSSGKLVISGVLQRADSFNQNLRRYPKQVLKYQAEQYKRTFIAENRALGELDHPEDSVVTLARVSHNMLDLWWEGENLMGKLELLPTPNGNIAKALIESGIRLGISSRGMGSVRELGEGKVEVQDDFEIVCWDLVSNPSTQGAFVGPQLAEGRIRMSTPVLPKYTKVDSLIDDIISMSL